MANQLFAKVFLWAIAAGVTAVLSGSGTDAYGQSGTTSVLAAPDDASKNDGKHDHEQIQGTWRVISAEDSGNKAPETQLKDLKWVITKDKIIYTFGDKTTEWTYKLDPTTRPKGIDLMVRGRTAPGIYELAGTGLRICFPEGDQAERSTAFESKPSSPNDVLIVLRREQPSCPEPQPSLRDASALDPKTPR